MACLVENRESNEIINKDRVHFPSFKMEEDYKFKYTPESHFKHVVKNVQRQRRKEDEERIWMSFVKEQELISNLRFSERDTHPSIQSVKNFLYDNMQDVDTELKRLQEDTLPEQNKGICICKSNNKDENTANTKVNNIQNYSPKQKLQIRDKDVYDTNILVPIAQRENVINYQDSKILKKMLRSKTKKCVSDSSIIQKKHANQCLHTINHLIENDSDSDSDLRNNKNNIVNIQADPLTIHKILSMQNKISALLSEISFRLSRIPLPDGNNDLKRRQQQTMEFAIRFSRNYLYNLNRLIMSIQRHIGAISTKTRLQHYQKSITSHQDMIKQNLIAAHQLLIQALNAYCKHIPNSTSDSHSTKLQNVLEIVSNLRDICNKVEISTNHFCSGDTNVSLMEKDLVDMDTILSKLKLSLEYKEQPRNHKNIEPTATLAKASLQNSGQTNKKNLSGRLSMYSIDVPKTNQRKHAELRRKKYTFQGEKKCKIGDIRNIHTQQFAVPELLYPSPVTHTSSSRDTVAIDCTMKTNYLKDDDIKTMMDEIPIDSENDSNIEIQTKRSNIMNIEQQSKGLQKKSLTEIWKSKSTKDKDTDTKEQSILNDDDLIEKVTTITKEHLSTLVPVISDLMTLVSKKKTELETQPISETSMGTLMEFLQKYQSSKDIDTKAILANSLSEIQKHSNNVQLICLSSVDKNSETKQRDASCQADETAINILSNTKTCLITKHKLELSTSKETKQQILTYRCNYNKACESKPMYSSNTQNKPWDIVAWISDKLIEELMMEVTKDLGVNELVQKLYDMEFQEF